MPKAGSRTQWTNISTKPKKFNRGAFRSQIVQDMKSRYVPEARAEHQKHSSLWKTQPTFTFDIANVPEGIDVQTILHGYGAKLWLWLGEGVEGHMIRPKSGGVLSFRVRGPKAPGGPAAPSKPGTSTVRVLIFSEGHWWPGIEPRKYDEKVAVKLKPKWFTMCKSFLKRGILSARR